MEIEAFHHRLHGRPRYAVGWTWNKQYRRLCIPGTFATDAWLITDPVRDVTWPMQWLSRRREIEFRESGLASKRCLRIVLFRDFNLQIATVGFQGREHGGIT